MASDGQKHAEPEGNRPRNTEEMIKIRYIKNIWLEDVNWIHLG
jgi:hypothetical protein